MEGCTLSKMLMVVNPYWRDYLWHLFLCFCSLTFSSSSIVNTYCCLVKGYWGKREHVGLTVRRFCLTGHGCLIRVRNWRLELSSGADSREAVVVAILCRRRHCPGRCKRPRTFVITFSRCGSPSGLVLIPPVLQVRKLESGESNLSRNTRLVQWERKSNQVTHLPF